MLNNQMTAAQPKPMALIPAISQLAYADIKVATWKYSEMR
jgi:hypothetical protein